MDIYLLVCLILFIAPISTILHELGHVIGAKSVKADSVNLSVGVGKDIGCISFKRISFTFHAIFFLGGVAFSERKIPYKPVEIVWITICGPLCNGLVAFIIYFLFDLKNDFFQLLMLFNIWLTVVNIIPFKIKGKQSDGYTILKAIFQSHTKVKQKE